MIEPLKLNRRDFLRIAAVSGGALLTGFDNVESPELPRGKQGEHFAGGKQLGTVDFAQEGFLPMDTALGTELDGRLYTDLSRLTAQDLVTPTENFYVRTRASKLLPDMRSWQISVDGLVERRVSLTIEILKKLAKPVGLHLMECAGNTRMARFGMIGVANWSGVPISEILDKAKVKPEARRVRIAGYDHYALASVSSVPGASWVFSTEELTTAGAFVATEMNSQPLTRDHGAPIRLVVPGWYGCACIKWVNNIDLVDETAEATSQMQEYAARTLQDGIPQLAKDYRPASIDYAALPIRIEKWEVDGKLKYRVVGILWGGSQSVKVLQIRFNPNQEYVRVEGFVQTSDSWNLWTHPWSPRAPGHYAIQLAVTEPRVEARKLDSGYYVRSVEITEV